MSQIPESTHSSSHWTIGLRSAESDGTRGRLCRPPGFPSASPPQWLVSGPRTLRWTSPASGCFAFYRGPATPSVSKAQAQTFILSLPSTFPPPGSSYLGT